MSTIDSSNPMNEWRGIWNQLTRDERWAWWSGLAREFGLELEAEGPHVDLDVVDAALIFSLDDEDNAVVTMRAKSADGTTFVFDMALEAGCVVIDDGGAGFYEECGRVAAGQPDGGAAFRALLAAKEAVA